MKYVCGICNSEYENLDGYLSCVNACGKKLKEKEEAEKRIKIDAALNSVKQAKAYFEQKLSEFKDEYPEEYELNFGSKKPHKKPMADVTKAVTKEEWDKEQERIKDNKISGESNKSEPVKVFANINGKEAKGDDALKLLESNSDTRHLARLLGLL